jgi:multicomponent Na+:H+ antiporter subunit G
MKIAADIFLGICVLMAWLGTFAFVRLETPLERVHAIAFINITVVGSIVVAAFFGQGVTSQTLKVCFIWIATVLIGALLSHVTGRAIHLRSGERR